MREDRPSRVSKYLSFSSSDSKVSRFKESSRISTAVRILIILYWSSKNGTGPVRFLKGIAFLIKLKFNGKLCSKLSLRTALYDLIYCNNYTIVKQCIFILCYPDFSSGRYEKVFGNHHHFATDSGEVGRYQYLFIQKR